MSEQDDATPGADVIEHPVAEEELVGGSGDGDVELADLVQQQQAAQLDLPVRVEGLDQGGRGRQAVPQVAVV